MRLLQWVLLGDRRQLLFPQQARFPDHPGKISQAAILRSTARRVLFQSEMQARINLPGLDAGGGQYLPDAGPADRGSGLARFPDRK